MLTGVKKGRGTAVNLFLKFLVVKMGPLNIVSNNAAVYKNVSTTLEVKLRKLGPLYRYSLH
jgi:hypothetical protein